MAKAPDFTVKVDFTDEAKRLLEAIGRITDGSALGRLAEEFRRLQDDLDGHTHVVNGGQTLPAKYQP